MPVLTQREGLIKNYIILDTYFGFEKLCSLFYEKSGFPWVGVSVGCVYVCIERERELEIRTNCFETHWGAENRVIGA